MGNDDTKIMIRKPRENPLPMKLDQPKELPENEKKAEENNVTDMEDRPETNQVNPELSENSQKYMHYLNFLYKNNFVSLNYDNLCAFLVQYRWRKYYIKQIKSRQKGMIDVIFSSMPSQSDVSESQNRVFAILDSKKYPYRCYDVLEYKNLVAFSKKNFPRTNYPLIYINGYFIGSADQLQVLEDEKLINKVLNKDYLDYCLKCHVTRDDLEISRCPYCFKKYTFFAKFDALFDIYSNR